MTAEQQVKAVAEWMKRYPLDNGVPASGTLIHRGKEMRSTTLDPLASLALGMWLNELADIVEPAY